MRERVVQVSVAGSYISTNGNEPYGPIPPMTSTFPSSSMIDPKACLGSFMFRTLVFAREAGRRASVVRRSLDVAPGCAELWEDGASPGVLVGSSTGLLRSPHAARIMTATAPIIRNSLGLSMLTLGIVLILPLLEF